MQQAISDGVSDVVPPQDMKRGRPEDHEGVFGQRRSFPQHPVLAPAPGAIANFENVQDNIASSLTQFGAPAMATTGYQ